MKCPSCGAWNQASLPRCFRCGTPLAEKKKTAAPAWQDDLQDIKPENIYISYAEDSEEMSLEEQRKKLEERETLGTEMEHLKERRKRGAEQLQKLRASARAAQEALSQAAIVKPVGSTAEEEEDAPAPQPTEPAGTTASTSHRRRRRSRTQAYLHAVKGEKDAQATPTKDPRVDIPEDERSVTESLQSPRPWEREVFTYVEDESAPLLYDGYLEPSPDHLRDTVIAATDPMFYEHQRVSLGSSQFSTVASTAYRKRTGSVAKSRIKKDIPFAMRIVLWVVLLSVVGVGATSGLLWAIDKLGVRDPASSAAEQTRATFEKADVGGAPGHIIRIEGSEGTQIYIRELQRSYVVTGGYAQIEVADSFWFEDRSDITEETMEVTLTPFVKYTAGEQKPMTTIHYTIDVPVSTARLIRPESRYAEVSTSITEIRLQVDRGSSVTINGENVTSLINANGYVSKNVQVEPVGENYVQVSVRNNNAREYSFEVTLYRAPQDIPLEMIPTTLSESELDTMQLTGTTLPGAEIILESPYEEGSLDLSQLDTTGSFTFTAYFPKIGDNEVKIRARYPGKEDSVLTHIVYYMPNPDVYTKIAWAMDATNYTEIINNIDLRKGQVYVCEGRIIEIKSEHPQIAVMETGVDNIERQVLVENSSKTTWVLGEVYMLFADAYGLYGAMPRLSARYTYTEKELGKPIYVNGNPWKGAGAAGAGAAATTAPEATTGTTAEVTGTAAP